MENAALSQAEVANTNAVSARPAQSRGLSFDAPGRHFNGDEPLQLIMVRQVDESEAALTEGFLRVVTTNVL